MRNKIISFLFTTLLCSCGSDVVNEYCSYSANYVIDFQYGHTASYLYTAVNSSNTFAFLSVSPLSGGYTLVTQLYGGNTHSENVTEAVLTQRSRYIGLSNGLVVGRSSLNDGTLYVFDRQCPNCYNETKVTRYTLNFKDASTLYCSNCQRSYGLLNGGVVVAGNSGEKLFRYRATYSGTTFAVQN